MKIWIDLLKLHLNMPTQSRGKPFPFPFTFKEECSMKKINKMIHKSNEIESETKTKLIKTKLIKTELIKIKWELGSARIELETEKKKLGVTRIELETEKKKIESTRIELETEKKKIESTRIELETEKKKIESILLQIETLKKELYRLDTDQLEKSTIEKSENMSAYFKLKEIGDSLHDTQNSANTWRNTPLEKINDLKADPAGKVGEEFLKSICLACDIPNESTGDKNSLDGTYDQKIGFSLKKVEIKTARIGGGKYQHESLKKDGCDFWVFIDIKPDGGCITILPRFDLTKKHTTTGTTPTLRKGTNDVFKWDFTDKHHDRLVSDGYAIRFGKTTPMLEIGDFIKSMIN